MKCLPELPQSLSLNLWRTLTSSAASFSGLSKVPTGSHCGSTGACASARVAGHAIPHSNRPNAKIDLLNTAIRPVGHARLGRQNADTPVISNPTPVPIVKEPAASYARLYSRYRGPH